MRKDTFATVQGSKGHDESLFTKKTFCTKMMTHRKRLLSLEVENPLKIKSRTVRYLTETRGLRDNHAKSQRRNEEMATYGVSLPSHLICSLFRLDLSSLLMMSCWVDSPRKKGQPSGRQPEGGHPWLGPKTDEIRFRRP